MASVYSTPPWRPNPVSSLPYQPALWYCQRPLIRPSASHTELLTFTLGKTLLIAIDYDKAMLSQAVSKNEAWPLRRALTVSQALFGLRKDLQLEIGIRYSMSCSNILSRLHRWRISSNRTGSALSHRKSHLRYRLAMGNMHGLYRRMFQLPKPLRSTLHPWHARIWRLPSMDACGWWLVSTSLSYRTRPRNSCGSRFVIRHQTLRSG